MKKILEYGLGIYCWLITVPCFAVDKFEVLPDLPDPLAAYAQSAEAAAVSGQTGVPSLVGGSVGQELNLISVVFALLVTLALFYGVVILYTKLNKANINILKKQQGNFAKSQASVISTTALGNNKTLHVIELDGKRMLIGASSGAIQLIKDLGSVSSDDVGEEFSHIEIPTIKIPKIEIPKIEIPSIGFSKLATRIHKEFEKNSEQTEDNQNGEVVTTKEEESQEGIIDSLFTQPKPELEKETTNNEDTSSTHKVDPDDYALYRKYL